MLELIFMLVALILFVLAAVGVSGGRINLLAAGLAFMAAALIVPLLHGGV